MTSVIPRMLKQLQIAFISAIFAVLTIQVIQDGEVKNQLKMGGSHLEEIIVKMHKNNEENRLG